MNGSDSNRRFFRPVFLALLVAGGTAIAATVSTDSGQTIRAVDLKDQPNADAASTASLPQSTHVEILKRQGAWLQVKAATGTGWVRMLSVRGEGGPTKSSGGGSLKALGNLMSTGSSGTAPVATGVRGLSEEDLANAHENPAQLEKMQSMAADASSARGFASQAKLQAQTVAYLAPATGKAKKGSAK